MHTLIFDIGKTNKKLFVFDKKYKEVYKQYVRFDPIHDEDGYPAEDLTKLTEWIKANFDSLIHDDEFKIDTVNFSTYGASLVHLDRDGQPLTPLYNYTKPIPGNIESEFYSKYGPRETFSRATASPPGGMLNSGLQLYWLKKRRPEIFPKICTSLHFPQYLSYLFTGIPVSEFTSIGCHTGLWDFSRKDYHDWVIEEDIDPLLAPIVPTSTSINITYEGRPIRVGVGIHDSSSALLPYIRSDKKRFLLISTGTWSVSLNPFSKTPFDTIDGSDNTLNYMRIDGRPVKATRLFLGNEYKVRVEELCDHFGVEYGYHRDVRFDQSIYRAEVDRMENMFHFESIAQNRQQPEASRLDQFSTFEHAFHRLMIELMELQVESAQSAMGNTRIRKIYIDGGFADNDIFVKLACMHFNKYKLRTTKSPLGSALGAAMVISDEQLTSKFLKKHYAMRKHKTLILQS